MSGELGLPGYVKQETPIYCDFLEDYCITRVVTNKNCTVCVESKKG